ncbi:Ferroxidase [Piloderma croceum F 1598]|uniref:Ferroxidase n=1 Tax=Piloderma croceum (strain F 1598) TaxID=765440 RepID=A0A0C3BNS9_PILCF|nr:Ferroxidase [Piloderma croceum F 1598]
MWIPSLTFLSPLLVLTPPVLAGIHEVWWNITYVENANPDGLHPRRVIGVNGTWPPPPISFNNTDTLMVHTTNSVNGLTTLHHHGLFFNSTSWMDGVLWVTQCGIPPGGTFTYQVPVDPTQWGTYWIHSHAKGQYVDGLRGPVTLHPPQEAYSYDEEFTVVLGDWYHTEHDILLAKYLSPTNPEGNEPVPDSGLIYFAQHGSYLPPKQGTHPTGPTSAVGFNTNATLPFVPGKTYRLRILNASAFASFYFWIDGHNMTIIEVDGTDIQKSPIDVLSIATAQRYSVLVTARNDTSLNWAVHANMMTSMFSEVPRSLNPNITSSITYNSSAPLAKVRDPGSVHYHDVNDMALVPLDVVPQPKATKTIELEVTFGLMTDRTNRAMFNNITFNYPLVPAEFSALSLGSNATVQEAYTPLSFVLDHLDVVDLVIKNGDSGSHPFHLHGHAFMIVGRSANYSSDNPKLNPPVVEGQPNPMRRDTIFIESGSSATLRFVADNPGVWFMHCHIEWHLEAGLAVEFIEAPLVMQQRSNVPQSMYDQCRIDGTPFSGNAAGHNSTTDLSGLPLGPFPLPDDSTGTE